MAVQLSVAVRNARLDAIETVVGTGPLLQLRTGAQPSDCAQADAGTLLCEMTLPSDWAAAASSGSKALLGTWQDVGVAAGTAAHYRLKDSGGTTCHQQGSVTITSGGGDIELDNPVIAVDQVVTISSFTMTDGNA